ncbi:MAG: LytTR family DNA-binding domain-containing protein [Myxococcota bacterium]
MKVLIVDDEAPARRHLARLIDRLDDDFDVGSAESGPAALAILQSEPIDLVLLDVQMPMMTGFDVVEAVGLDRMPFTVFVTAFDEHALRAFDVEAIDYVLKPVGLSRLRQAIERVKRRILNAKPAAQTPPLLHRLVATQGEAVHLVAIKDVTHILSAANYVEAFTSQESYLVRQTLQRLEAQLDPAQFARIHRTTIVRIDAVAEVEARAHGDGRVVLKCGRVLRLSRRYRAAFLERASFG